MHSDGGSDSGGGELRLLLHLSFHLCLCLLQDPGGRHNAHSMGKAVVGLMEEVGAREENGPNSWSHKGECEDQREYSMG